MYGADADLLDEAAAQLTTAADELDASATTLTSSLGSVEWLGQVAVRFTDLWRSGHQPRMTSVATFLRENAERLRRDATQQRTASGATAGTGHGATPAGSGASSTTPKVGSGFDDAIDRMQAVIAAEVAEIKRLRAISDPLAPALAAARNGTDAQQLAWWNSLTADQQHALLEMRSGELTALHGLPADVLVAARKQYTSLISGELVTSSSAIHAEAAVSIEIADVGGGFDVSKTRFKDGSVEVDLSTFLQGGVGVKDMHALVQAGLGGKFEFDSNADAEKFLSGLEHEIKPGWGEMWASGGNLAAASTLSMLNYLRQQHDHLGSVSVNVGEAGSFGAAGNHVDADVGVEVSRDTKGLGEGDITISAHQSYSGQMSDSVMGVSGKVEVGASATFDGVTPTSMTFSMNFQHATLGGAFTPVGESTLGVTHSGSAQITFDLTQPELRAAADAAVVALKRGDVTAATNALSSVVDRAQITLQDQIGAQSNSSIDLEVVSGSVSSEVHHTVMTSVKPPGGSFYEVK